MRSSMILAGLLLCLAWPLTAAGPLGVDQVLREMERTNLRLEDMQADFVQTKVMALFDERIESRGKFYFRNPDKLVLDTRSPEHQLLIVNHNQVWLHYPDLKQVHQYSSGQQRGMEALFVGFGGSVQHIREQFQVSLAAVEQDAQGRTLYTLSLSPLPGSPAASPALGLERVELTVREGEWYPIRNRIVQKNGDHTELVYSNQQLNLKLNDSRFTFQAPAGTEVITHRSPSGASE